MRRALLLTLSMLAACGGQRADVDLPENIREQLHQATGHEDGGDCLDLRGEVAVITLGGAGIEPSCLIVNSAQDVTIDNPKDSGDTWIVADAETEAEIPRHTRMVFEVSAASTGTIEAIGEHVGTGVWPCYTRESSFDCRIAIVP